MFKQILIPLDGSPYAEKAIAPALEIAQAFDSEITLVRVPEPMRNKLDDLEGGHQIYETIRSQQIKEISAYLMAIQTDLRSKGYAVHIKIVTTGANPSSCLLNLLFSNNFDLVVMTTHGRRGVEKWIMGSVSDRVVKNTTTPILLIHPTENE